MKIGKFNVLVTGVGGEGVLLTSLIIERAANLEGYDVKGMQIHGLAQRGGPVPTHIRFGKDVHSPIIPRGEADLIIALEPIEAARSCYFASKEKTNFLLDNYPIVPGLTKIRNDKYPGVEDIRKMIKPFSNKIIVAEASSECAKELGNFIFGNIYMLGVALAGGFLPLRMESVEKAMKMVISRSQEEDKKALEMGMTFARTIK